MEFYSPKVFLILLVLPLLAFFAFRRKNDATLRFSSVLLLKGHPVSLRQRLRPLLVILRLACIAVLVVALARPRKGISLSNVSIEGVAMNLVLDRSTSMTQEMKYKGKVLTRLDVAQNVIGDFIKGDKKTLKGRKGDLVGLVSFARYPDTNCPLVQSHQILLDFLKQIKPAQDRSEDGTAIGEAVELACARLNKAEEQLLENNLALKENSEKLSNDFEIKSKAIILLTDGINNQGDVQPLEAAKTAQDWGIKIYAIGIGQDTTRRTFGGMQIPVGAQLDEKLLNEMAEMTGGFYQRADSAEALKEIYQKIDKLETTEIKSMAYFDYSEKFTPWAIAAMWILLFEVFLRYTLLRKIP